MFSRLAEIMTLEKRIVDSSCLMDPFEPLYALFDQPIMAGNAICRNVALTETQGIGFCRHWVPLNPAAERLLEMVLVKHNVSPPPT